VGEQRYGREIADDDVASIDVGSETILFVTGKSTGAGVGIYFMGFNTLLTVQQSGSTTNQGSTTLTGTTGPDGSLNIARDNNTLLLENRTGESEGYYIKTMKGAN
jgi:hypothetical protein